MYEILDENFETSFGMLLDAVSKASFITIDTEFTGINTEESLRHSFFDTVSDRYNSLKRNIQPFVIIQFGIGTFHHVSKENAYIAQCFNFYLFPRPVPFKNRQFSFQVTALEFLYKHNFEFNKFISKGISYLDEIDEKLLKEYIEQGNILNNYTQLTYDEENHLKECKDKVLKWLAEESNQTSLNVQTMNPILQYILHKQLRSSFENIWTTSGYKSIDIVKVTNEEQVCLEKENSDCLESELLNTCIGFSKVFKLLSSCKKPIVGHNMLLDLMFIHQQFYKPLPDSYKEFKKNIHSLFPQMYDTKYLTYELQRLLKRDEVIWKQSSLNHLYEFFSSNRGRQLVFNSPQIILNTESLVCRYAHNAGWDAYCTGYIFAKIGHILAIQKYGKGLEERSVTHPELMSAVKDFVNCVNITKGDAMCMKFDGTDPPLSRPEWLHVKLKSPTIDTKELVEKFSHFGPVDVMPFSQKGILVAVSNHKSALRILEHFEGNKEFQVARYSRIRYAASTNIFLWSGLVLIGGGVATWMVKKMTLKST
ncbi:Pre-piRNA 3'-exonuclease trimmer [Anthophora plagiata]